MAEMSDYDWDENGASPKQQSEAVEAYYNAMFKKTHDTGSGLSGDYNRVVMDKRDFE